MKHNRGSYGPSARTRLVVGALLVAAMGGGARTAQAPADPPFFFLQLSDPQFGMFTADRDFAQETANFEFAIASANRRAPSAPCWPKGTC